MASASMMNMAPRPVLMDAPDISHEDLPASLAGSTIWIDASGTHESTPEALGTAEAKKRGAARSGFSFGKALKGGICGTEGCASSSRGDGKFEDGSNVRREWVEPARVQPAMHTLHIACLGLLHVPITHALHVLCTCPSRSMPHGACLLLMAAAYALKCLKQVQWHIVDALLLMCVRSDR